MSVQREQGELVSTLGSVGEKHPLTFLGVSFVILLWFLLSYSMIVSPLLLPPPHRVLQAAFDIGPKLLLHLLATVTRIITGLFFGSLFGMALGIIMQYSRKSYLLLDGIVETARPVPPVALVPFFILWFGFSEIGKVLLVTIGTGLVVTVATVEAIERVPQGILRWGLVSGLSRRHLFQLVLIPASIPEMRTGFRVALAVGITLVIVAEFMGATFGVGYLINQAKVTLNTATIFLGIIIIGWTAWGLDKLLRYFLNLICIWDTRAKGATL